MVLRTIGEDISPSQDLPWVNEYVNLGGSIGNASFVRTVKKTENGFLILAEDFKGFLFSKSQIAKFLAEALEVWVSNSSPSFPLYAVVAKGGKLSLAIDDEEVLTIWIEETKDRSWEQKRKKERENGSLLPKFNPFLPNPTPPPTQKERKKPKSYEHPDLNAMPY